MLKSYNIRALSFQRPSRSSQCVTLLLSSWSRVQLYRRCDTKVIFTKKDVIPVSSTGMTKRGCWNDKKGATWMARKEHWDDKRSDE